jgi:hypothetical protein
MSTELLSVEVLKFPKNLKFTKCKSKTPFYLRIMCRIL